MPQGKLNPLNVAGGTPPFRNECLMPDVVVEQIERLVHSLLLSYEIFPAEEALANCDKLCASSPASIVQRHLEVFYAHGHLTE